MPRDAASNDADRKRLFFSLWPDDPVRTEIIAGTRQAIEASGGQPVRGENLHLTLAFLHNVETKRLPCIVDAAARAAGTGFSLTLSRIGHWSRSGILWAAPSPRCTMLAALEAGLWRELADCGFTPEYRTFKPHVTLARKATTPFSGPIPAIHWQVRDFVLVESITGRSRSTYRVLERWPLPRPDAAGEG
jgi:2'-5' RNA ligase